ncbi:MAG TPA: MDR family MFS transporter [Galbitalea sp.]|jgi:EmrB/QacA subfamily drug resistance transporter
MTSTSPAHAAPELLPDRRLTLLSVVLLLGAIASILDTTIVNVALDHLHIVFHATVADTQWVSTGYLLALAGVIPLTGWASERFGSQQVWFAAVLVFLMGSVLCGFAWNLPSLIGFRVLQGLGGGMILPVTISILTQAAGPARLSRAMAAIALPGQLGPILGPVIGGAIVDSINWNWLFFVNVPICLAALVLASKLLPSSAHDRTKRLDVAGFALLTPGLVGIAYGISQAVGVDGFGALRAWLPLAVGAILVAGFVIYSLRTRRVPLLDVRLFANRSFGLAGAITFVGGFSMFAVTFLLPLFYQVVRGDSALVTGLLLIPQGVGTVTFILLQQRLLKHFSARTLIIAGLVVTTLASIPFLFAAPTGGDVLLLAAQYLRGFGSGMSLIPMSVIAFGSMARSDVPRGSAAFSVVQRVGAPFGVTVIAVLLESIGAHATTGAAVASAFDATFGWVLVFSAVPLALALLLPRAKRAAAAPVPTAEPAEPVIVD